MCYEEIIEQKKRQVEKLNRKLDNYIEMRAEGDIDKESFAKKTSEIRADITRLTNEIDELEDAQEYAYSISPTKRVRSWRDIEVNLYI